MYMCLYTICACSHLLVSLEDIASESTVGKFSSDVAEYLHVLGVVGYVEYPAANQRSSDECLYTSHTHTLTHTHTHTHTPAHHTHMPADHTHTSTPHTCQQTILMQKHVTKCIITITTNSDEMFANSKYLFCILGQF